MGNITIKMDVQPKVYVKTAKKGTGVTGMIMPANRVGIKTRKKA